MQRPAEPADAPDLTHLCDFEIDFARTDVDITPLGTRLTYVIDTGKVTGTRLTGTFLAGGGDWVTVGTDGVARLDVRATFRTDDGALIRVTNTGRAVMNEETTARLAAGASIGWDEMYARSSPLFETGHADYAWLNGLHTVAVNEFSLSTVGYRVFEVR
jgi:hypothetical protein